MQFNEDIPSLDLLTLSSSSFRLGCVYLSLWMDAMKTRGLLDLQLHGVQ